MNRYHAEIGFPGNVDALFDRYFDSFEVVRYSRHAKRATVQDRYGVIPVVKSVRELSRENCFELVTEGSQIVKAVFRLESESFDYCYSISCEGIVVTCWVNVKNDVHSTLDRTAYVSV